MRISKLAPRSWQVFHLPKNGNRPEEYEDAYAADPETGRYAVADGATESSYAALWARLLVEDFVRSQKRLEPLDDWLEPLQKRWAGDVEGRELPWFAEEKRALGAFSTFLGLMVGQGTFTERGAGGEWSALAVGDSCLFQVRGDRLLAAFPLWRSTDFNNQPTLLGSRKIARALPRLRREQGKWQADDQFLLMTDALAQWFFRQCESGNKPWQALAPLLVKPVKETVFPSLIEHMRQEQNLRNDDVTLLVIHL